jgi:predicted nucleic acid-binding protein
MLKQIVLDTNILVFFFDGNKNAASYLLDYESCISSITQIEISSNKSNTSTKKILIEELVNGIIVVQTNPVVVKLAINFMLSYNIKIADAIIAATAKYLDLPLLTADAELFKIKEVKIIKFLK